MLCALKHFLISFSSFIIWSIRVLFRCNYHCIHSPMQHTCDSGSYFFSLAKEITKIFPNFYDLVPEMTRFSYHLVSGRISHSLYSKNNKIFQILSISIIKYRILFRNFLLKIHWHTKYLILVIWKLLFLLLSLYLLL